MTRRGGKKLKRETIDRRNREKFLKLMAEADAVLGTKTDIDEKKLIEHQSTSSEEMRIVEAEATLLYFELRGQGFTRQICPQCKREFAYKYTIPGGRLKCSDTCRAEALAEIGIVWNYSKRPEERWSHTANHGTIPLIVPPEALTVLDKTVSVDTT